MDGRSVDLNLLVVFRAVMEHRGLTRAGMALGLSQPAMSANLVRLREHFGDPLFVRTGSKMVPTPLAEELAEPLGEILDRLEADVLRRGRFDPATSQRSFTIVTPDIGELELVPELVAQLQARAPGITLRTISRHPQATPVTLESGEADLAFGFFPDLHRPGFYQLKLFDAHDMCIVRKGHPIKGSRITMDQYLAASHAVVRPDGRSPERGGVPDRDLRVVAVVSTFSSLLTILATTDLIANGPFQLTALLRRYDAFRTLEMPWEPTPIPIHLFWHSRLHKDSANVWLRRLIYSRFGSADLNSPDAIDSGSG